MSNFEEQIQRISEALGNAEQLMNSACYQEAAEILQSTLDIIEKTHTESIYKADCLEGLGEVYFEMQDFSRSSQFDLRLLALLEKSPSSNVRTIIRVLLRLGNSHRTMGYQVKAVEFFASAVDRCDKSLSSDDPLYKHALECYEHVLAQTGGDKRTLQQLREKMDDASGVPRESLARSVPVMKAALPADLARPADEGAEPAALQHNEEEHKQRVAQSSALRTKESRYVDGMASMPLVVGAILVVLVVALLAVQLTHR